MSDTITILFPDSPGSETLTALQADLSGLTEVAQAGSAATRSIGAAELVMWVGFAADALAVASVASATVRKIVNCVREKRIRGAVIELPNGIRISIDSASADKIKSLVSAWKQEETQWSRHKTDRD